MESRPAMIEAAHFDQRPGVARFDGESGTTLSRQQDDCLHSQLREDRHTERPHRGAHI